MCRRILPLCLLAALPAVGCPQTSSSDKGAEGGEGDDSGSGGETSIYDVQTGAVEDGEAVRLEGVAISSGITADGDAFFVQDPDGGEYSGLYIYLQGVSAPAVYEGDLVNINGTVSEYYDFTELVIASEADIEVVGELSEALEPEALSGTEAWTAADWEPWESVLVRLASQTVESDVNSYGEAQLSAGIPMDNLFFDFTTEYGATYTSVSGPITYSFEAFKINPRSEADLAGYVPGEGPEDVAIQTVQMGQQDGEYEGRSVLLEGVVVTSGLSHGNDGFFVQEPGGGEWSGIYVYTAGIYEKGGFDLAIGDVVDLAGRVVDYGGDGEDTVTELGVYDAADIVSTGTTEEVVASVIDEADKPDSAEDWESWEGCLVELSNVGITSDPSKYGQIETDWNIILDDTLYYYTDDFPELGNGATVETLRGLVHFAYGERLALPRDASDLGG